MLSDAQFGDTMGLVVTSTTSSLLCRVQVTVVDVYGQRHVLRALTGHTLVDVLSEHQELLGDEGMLPRNLHMYNACTCTISRGLQHFFQTWVIWCQHLLIMQMQMSCRGD